MEIERMTKEQFFKKYYKCSPDNFDWKKYSWHLCGFHSKKLNIWWDPQKFNWKIGNSWKLCEYCSEYFNIWYNPDKFNWKKIDYLKNYCKKYKEIWNNDYVIRELGGGEE